MEQGSVLAKPYLARARRGLVLPTPYTCWQHRDACNTSLATPFLSLAPSKTTRASRESLATDTLCSRLPRANTAATFTFALLSLPAVVYMLFSLLGTAAFVGYAPLPPTRCTMMVPLASYT